MPVHAEKVLKETIARITGLKKGYPPLGSIKVENGESETQNIIADFFKNIIGQSAVLKDARLIKLYNRLKNDFIRFYSISRNRLFLEERWKILTSLDDNNLSAKAVTEIWAPEVSIADEDILPKWKLSKVSPNKKPYKPEEVVLQVNGLYSLPDSIPEFLHRDIRDEWNRVIDIPDDVVFDYDHPVPIFSPDDSHELISCLNELDEEIGFEKTQGIFRADYKVPVVLSISVTHPRIDRLCSMWLRNIMEEKHYKNMRFYYLSEGTTGNIKKALDFYPRRKAVFSVSGKYANHFNTLKYFQLILEKTHGIRTGFKIDADEGIRSGDLQAATGKTWFQTLCHEYWGGTAEDARGMPVYLGVNAGEYINEGDIKTFGYENSLRKPDVKFDGNFIGTDIFFNKGIAHARATALYNKAAGRLDDFISHPVVKGGGYGIDNYSLRKYAPFTFSEVGRAEDQQFYLSGLAKGVNGIFTPDLRIAHYKQSLARSESTTEATRFLGDMFRLVIFQEIVGFLGVKDLIDPMPGVFAGELARIQAFFSILYKSYSYCAKGETYTGDLLFERGLKELQGLIDDVESGRIRQQWEIEQNDFETLIDAIDTCNRNELFSAVLTMEVK